MKKDVLLVVIDDDKSAEAIRQTLEVFGASVRMKYIGRPSQFDELLAGNGVFEDIIIMCGHGSNGEILMPKLDESVYFREEERGNYTDKIVSSRFSLRDKLIISLCCTSGRSPLSDVFAKNNTYIAPISYINGAYSVLFVHNFFYNLFNGNSLNVSLTKASISLDSNDKFTLKSNVK